MSDFKDKVVLVTGAGRGLGRAIAEAFASLGARVAANDLTPVNLDETLRRINQAGGLAREYLFDVARRMPVQAMVDQVLEDLGRIDILVNHARVEPRVPLLDMDEWDWQRTLDVNLGGAFFATQQVGRAMRLQGGGVVVNVVSLASRAYDQSGRAAYLASQLGLVGLTREAARELAAHGIRVNAVCSGPLEAGVIQASPWDAAILQPCLSAASLERLGHLQGVVAPVLYLCCPAAAPLTGQVIQVDDSDEAAARSDKEQ
jgi:NAD(P)-dependent dehydrogenase (short-subunit alcohol dehydrogenase family)